MEILHAFEKLEKNLNKAELYYRLNGETDDFLNCEKEFTKFLGDKCIFNEIEALLKNSKDYYEKLRYNYIYTYSLMYQGDSNLRMKIISEEKRFRVIRKKVSHDEYEKELRRLVKLRNKFAQTVGCKNYLELQYKLSGVDENLLKLKIEKSLKSVYEKYNQYLNIHDKQAININIDKDWLKTEKQLTLAEKTIKKIGIDLKSLSINFHIEPNDKKVGAGAVVPVSIPNDIHIINNSFNGLVAFDVLLMHEAGHAIYYSNIDKNLPYELRKSYNSMMDEGIALFFESLVFAKEWFDEFLNMEYPIYNIKECITIPQQICCVKFETDIYNNPDESFDDLWKNNLDKYFYDSKYSWTKPHFFISQPGYFSAYLLGEFFANDLKQYLIKKNGLLLKESTGEFLIDKVFKFGKTLDFQSLLKTISF